MLKRLNRYWRVLATGASFVVFAIGGRVLRALVFPLLNLISWEHQLRRLVVTRGETGLCPRFSYSPAALTLETFSRGA